MRTVCLPQFHVNKTRSCCESFSSFRVQVQVQQLTMPICDVIWGEREREIRICRVFSALNNALSKQGEKWIQSEYKTNTWVSSQPVRVVDVCLHFQWAVRDTCVMTSFVNCHYQIVKCKMQLPQVQLLRVANAIECSLSALYQTSHMTPAWVCVCVCGGGVLHWVWPGAKHAEILHISQW